MRTLCKILLLAIVLACSAHKAIAQEQDKGVDDAVQIRRRIDALETQLDALQGELTRLKEQARGSGVQEDLKQVSETQSRAQTLGSLLGPTYVSGFVDAYYGYNANHPVTRNSSFRSFDTSANQFSLNLAQLQVEKTPELGRSRTGYRVSLGFGQAINAVNGSDPAGLGFDQYLKEAYLSYLFSAGKGLQVDVGKFVTPHGAEVIETKDNWNYSRGLLFSYAIPYFHFGIRAKQTLTDKTWVAGYVVNGWNNVVDNNTGKTFGVGFGWNPSTKFSFAQNYMTGPEQADSNSDRRHLFDTLVTISPTDKLSLMANYTYGRGDRNGAGVPVYWNGIAGYAKYTFNEKYAIATRYEYYNDHDGFTTGTAQHFNGVTGTFQRMLSGNLLTRIEFRRDISNRPTFMRGNNVGTYSQNTATAGLVLMFDSREAK